jgi:hypothetical protein
MMQHSACISKPVFPQGHLGEIQFLCSALTMPASFQELKVRLPFSLMKHCAMKMCGGIWELYELNIGCRLSFTPRPLYPQGKSTSHSLDRGLYGPQRLSGHFGKEKNLLALQGIEPWTIWFSHYTDDASLAPNNRFVSTVNEDKWGIRLVKNTFQKCVARQVSVAVILLDHGSAIHGLSGCIMQSTAIFVNYVCIVKITQ